MKFVIKLKGLKTSFLKMETFEKKQIEKEIEEIIEPFLKEEGYILVDVNWKGKGRKGKIEIFVDSPSGITIKDTKKLAEEISELLYLRSISLDYILEVSSPGLDRVLKKRREYEWAKGKDVRVVYNEGKEEKGTLVYVNDNKIIIQKEDNLIYIDFSKIKKTQLMEWNKNGKI